jgi:hypothetical protein
MLHLTSSTNIASLLASTAWKGHQDRFSRMVTWNVQRLRAWTHVAAWKQDQMSLDDYLLQQVDNWRFAHEHKNKPDKDQDELFQAYLEQKQRGIDACYDPNTVKDMDQAMQFELRRLLDAVERTGGRPDDLERIRLQCCKEWTDAQQKEPLFAAAWRLCPNSSQSLVALPLTSDDEEEQRQRMMMMMTTDEDDRLSTLPAQPETPPVNRTTGQVRELDVISWTIRNDFTSVEDFKTAQVWRLIQSVWKPEVHGLMTRTEQFVYAINQNTDHIQGWRLWSPDDVQCGLRMIFLCFWTWTLERSNRNLGQWPVLHHDGKDSIRIQSALKEHGHVSGLVTAMLAYLSVLVNPDWTIKPSRARTVAAAVACLVQEQDNELRDDNGIYANVLDKYNSQEAELPPVREVVQVKIMLSKFYGGSVPLFRSTGWISDDELAKIQEAERIVEEPHVAERSVARFRAWSSAEPVEAKQSVEQARMWNQERVTVQRYRVRQGTDKMMMTTDEIDSSTTSSSSSLDLLRSHAEWLAWLFRMCDTRLDVRRTLEFLLSSTQEQTTLLSELRLHGQKALTRYDNDRWNVKALF